jgi:hypothetical protein
MSFCFHRNVVYHKKNGLLQILLERKIYHAKFEVCGDTGSLVDLLQTALAAGPVTRRTGGRRVCDPAQKNAVIAFQREHGG